MSHRPVQRRRRPARQQPSRAATVRRRAPVRRAPPKAEKADKGWGLAPYASKVAIHKAVNDIYPLARDAAKMAASAGMGYLTGSNLLGSALVAGLGDYEIKKNVFMQGRLPEMINVPQGGGTVIRFQEYLGDVITSSSANTFNLTSYKINAAKEGTFPWLAQIAANYEQYSFEGLLFEFRSTSADALNSTNTALGTVILATNYDAADANFASKSEMLNYEFSTSVKPSESVLHMVECDPNQTVLSDLYCLNGDVPSGKDERFYNLGNFQIATTGFQGSSVNVGELHVTYQVRLLKPKLFVALGAEIASVHFTQATGITNALPLGTAASVVEVYDNLGITFDSGIQISLPKSNVKNRYMGWCIWGGTAAAVVAPNITFTNGTNVGLASLSQTPASGVSSVNIRCGFCFDTAGDGSIPQIVFGAGGTLPTGSTTLTFYMTQVANDLA